MIYRRRKGQVITIVACLQLFPIIMIAKTETRFNTGACVPPNARIDSWWSTTTYVDGVPVKVSGRDCMGNIYWDRPIQRRVVAADPTIGMTPTESGTDDNGNLWYSVVLFNDDHDPIWMGGKTGDGIYWAVDSIDLNFE